MDEQASVFAGVIGERIKHERLARRWTLDELAELSGVSRRMVINVEQGSANPSIGTLLRLSDALGIGLPALVEPVHAKGVKVTQRGGGAVLWNGAFGGRGVLMAGTESPDVVELWDWTLGPGDKHLSETHAVGTRELLQVLEGTVTITVDGETVTLEVGDAASFSSDVPHSYANLGTKLARFSLAVFEPGVGRSGPRSDAAH